MNFNLTRSVLSLAFVATTVGLAPSSYAHFLWLKTINENEHPQAFLFFGENVTDEAYHLPERMAETTVWRRDGDEKRTRLEMENLETDERIGLVAPLESDEPCVLEANQPYGVYGKSLLVYYAKHVFADSQKQLNAAGKSKKLKLDLVPKAKDGKLEVKVFWGGKPLADAEVSIAVGDAETMKMTTDDDGRITFNPDVGGIVSVLANHLDKGPTGEHDGEKYTGVLHYASLTFNFPTDAQPERENQPPAESQSALPPLPEPLSSFGAAVADGWLYVYSGHIGEEHRHSAENLSKRFHRIRLESAEQADWESLTMQTPLQGLALVSHGGKLYRVGGLTARNATADEDEDLHSVAEFAQFDPATGQWQSLSPLPTPRSSHNAAVIGNRLYVVGGWHLHGESPGDWQEDALVHDFDKPQDGWRKLPTPPFKRRALGVGVWQDKLVAIGGMNAEGNVSRRVDIFDPHTGKWSRGPKLPGGGLAGFGAAAVGWGGNLYVSGLRGILYRLNENGSDWEEAARLATPRFFHQLLPAGDQGLLAIGGASRKGHLAGSERIEISDAPVRRSDTAQLTPGSAARAAN